jgi:hypothetical protein
MAPLKQKGDLAELMVAADLRRRGYKISIPFGEDCDYDFVVERRGRLERVQVKQTTSDGSIVTVRCLSLSLTNGRVKTRKLYTAQTVDWIAAWESRSGVIYYVPSSVFDGFSQLSLRLAPTRNNQSLRIRHAADFLEI